MPTPGLSGLHAALAHGAALEEIRGLDHLAEKDDKPVTKLYCLF